MKKQSINILNFFLILCVVTSLSSCEDVQDGTVANEVDNLVLSELDITEIELDQTNPGNPVATFMWSEADFGVQTAENYRLEFSDTENFENTVVVANLTGITNITLTTTELNTAAGSVGFAPFEWNTLYARVTTFLGQQNALAKSSNTISFDVYPYFNYPFEEYYLVGNATSADWQNNNNNPPLFRDAENPDLFSYTGFFSKGGGGINDGRFKVLDSRGMWQPQWGTTFSEPDDPILNSGEIAGNPTTQDTDPGRFGVETDGYYTFTINFGNNEYSIEPYDASNATDFTSIALQGSGISANAEMNQLAFDSHIWYINGVNLNSGGIQFLTNEGSSWGGDTAFSGVASEGGNEIDIILSDDYDVWFNDLTGEYIFIPLNF